MLYPPFSLFLYRLYHTLPALTEKFLFLTITLQIVLSFFSADDKMDTDLKIDTLGVLL